MLKSTSKTWGLAVDLVLGSCEDRSYLYPVSVVSKWVKWTIYLAFARLSYSFSSLLSPIKNTNSKLLIRVLPAVSTPPITTTTFLLINNYSFSK